MVMKVFRMKKVVKKMNSTYKKPSAMRLLRIGPWSISFAESRPIKVATFQFSKVCISKKVNIDLQMLL